LLALMPKILIVDDSPTIRKMVRVSLRALGDMEFLEAGNGLEAIEQVALAPVALMVLDLNMPDMHGVDVLKFIRRHQRTRVGGRDAVPDQAVRTTSARRRRRRAARGICPARDGWGGAVTENDGTIDPSTFAGLLEDYFAECDRG
jgi:CheY-like chemotaxis protein